MVAGQCTCGGWYQGKGRCDRNCPKPEGPGRRRRRETEEQAAGVLGPGANNVPWYEWFTAGRPPLTSEAVAYCANHRLELTVGSLLYRLARTQPDEPYKFLAEGLAREGEVASATVSKRQALHIEPHPSTLAADDRCLRRRIARDDHPYTELQFLAWYGGNTRPWEEAAPVESRVYTSGNVAAQAAADVSVQVAVRARVEGGEGADGLS